MNALVRTTDGIYLLDLETEEFTSATEDFDVASVSVELPRVVATAASGSTIAVVVDRRPPLAISSDAGRTWREAGGGLPPGFAIAVHDDDPDTMLFGARNRVYISTNGGIFWRALTPELPDIEALTFA